MVNNNNLLRIIDETSYVINKKNSKKKKKAPIPGSLKFKEPLTISKPFTDQDEQRHPKIKNVTDNSIDQYNDGDLSPLSVDQIRALEENDSFSRMFQRELEDLMIPAKSYGINVSELFSISLYLLTQRCLVSFTTALQRKKTKEENGWMIY